MRKRLFGLLLTGFFVGGTALLMGQTPFSGQSLKPPTALPTASKEGKKPGLWGSIGKKVRQTYRTLATRLNTTVTNGAPPAFVSKAVPIPGHDGPEFICQGISHLPDRITEPPAGPASPGPFRYALLSFYPDPERTRQPAQLVVVDTDTGRPWRRFGLFHGDGVPYTGHAGGIAVAGAYVWVASGYKIRGFKLREILDFVQDSTARPASTASGIPSSLRIPALDLVAAHEIDVDSKAGFISFDGTQLWVGDFVRSGNADYAPVKHHTQNPYKMKTWIAGYRVNAEGLPTASQKYTYQDGDTIRTAFKPDRLIYCRESVQGMAICGAYVALSLSYGAQNSKLAFYRSPLSKPGTRISFTPAGQKKTFTAESWVLGEKVNWLKTVKLAAGAEDLEYDGRRLYVTFESAAPRYRGKWIAINPLIRISERFYLLDPAKILY